MDCTKMDPIGMSRRVKQVHGQALALVAAVTSLESVHRLLEAAPSSGLWAQSIIFLCKVDNVS